jgi:hypothetical protein
VDFYPVKDLSVVADFIPVEPEFGRDFTVAVVLIAAIVGLATGSIALGLSVIAAAIAVLGLAALVRSRSGAARVAGSPSRTSPRSPRSH